MRLPTGIQDFTRLRENGYLYVDKTMYMMPFLQGGRFFLSRPRRFGKSLLVSTLQAAFSGRKDLFAGLWLEDKFDFSPCRIIRLDFSLINYGTLSLDQGIVEWLKINALEYGYALQSQTAKSALRELILEFSQTAQVVVFIDEYDKPITDYLLEANKRKEHQAVLKNVYGVLKPLDSFLHLVLLTGVSKIGKLSLFSDLNNLQDISLDSKYVNLCGYSKSEIETHFAAELESVQQDYQINAQTLWDNIRRWYNGYSWDGVNRLYCPFSFLLFLEQKDFKTYWYETGTPGFLVDLVRSAQLNPLELEYQRLDAAAISATDLENLDLVGLMFQTGYLTIQQKIRNLDDTTYILGYPNKEVQQAFSKSLLENYAKGSRSEISSFALDLRSSLQALDWASFFAKVNQTFARIPYEIFKREEAYPHSLLHLMLLSTGFRVQSQVQTNVGRMDVLLETNTHRIIFEIKLSSAEDAKRPRAEDALLQIHEKDYAASLEPPVVRVGLVFDFEQKKISQWKTQS
jgi:Predicted AAA-ATPase/PD-(D/E)XK nuclease superfamily